MADAPVGAAKAKKVRSPAYPGINLQQAIKRTAEFYEKEHRNPASFKAAVSHWDYSEKSSGALVAVAALKSFGLVDEIESAIGRIFQVSPLGLKIVADKRPDSPERAAAIKEAALRPKIHAGIWRKYNGTIPSDAELQYQLENVRHFNLKAIGPFIQELRETIAFAKLSESDKIAEETEMSGDETGENSTVPIGEAEIVDSSTTPAPPPALRWTRAQLHPPSGGSVMRDDVYSLDDGRQVVISWPSPLPVYEAENIKAWLAIVEKKIARSASQPVEQTEATQ
jgi:hypothetical protein